MTKNQLTRLYLSIKKHYSSKTYDLSKDKIIHLRSGQEIKEGIFLLNLYSRLKSKKAIVTYIISNIAIGNENFLYNMNEESMGNYERWVAYRDSYTYRILQENEFISKVLDKNNMVFDQLFEINDENNLPPILSLYLGGKVSIHYMCHLDNSKNFLTGWLSNSKLAMLFEKDILRIQKTKYFLTTLEKHREITYA